MSYCNINTDLKDVYPQIDQYKSRLKLTGFTLASGQTKTYQKIGPGYVELVFQDGAQLTVKTSVALCEATAGTFWYDEDNDILYVHATGDTNLNTSTTTLIEAGLDWDGFKTRMRNKAEEYLDSYLNRKYPTPLMPRLVKTHVTDSDYEYPVVRACALLTCAFIIGRIKPDNPVAASLMKQTYNANPEVGEDPGIINQILSGDMVLQEQISGREPGNWNIYPSSSNSGTGYVAFVGKYYGAAYEKWRVQIDTAGTPGTATYKLSYDTGTNWDYTLQETFNTDDNDRRVNIGSGIYCVFWGTFVLNDYWDLELFPMSDSESVTGAKIGTIEASR